MSVKKLFLFGYLQHTVLRTKSRSYLSIMVVKIEQSKRKYINPHLQSIIVKMSGADSITDGVEFSMTPSVSNWDNFQCWTQEERSALIEEMGFTEKQMSVFPFMHFKTDDYTLESLAFALFFGKALGMRVELFDFYDGASTLIAEESETAIFHFQVLDPDFEPMAGVEAVSGAGESQTRWMVTSDIVQDMKAEHDDECTFNLDEWQTFANPQVVSLMSSANEVVIAPDEQGKFGCGELDGCMHGDSTWYPLQCDLHASNCTVLLQFLPEHDLMNRRIITDNNLLLVIKYMGSSLSPSGQSNFKTFYDGDFRVIFQFRSIDLQSNNDLGWTEIPLPPHVRKNLDHTILRLRPSWLLDAMRHLYAFQLSFASLFGTDDAVHVTSQIIAAVQSGGDDSRDLRMQLVCDRLKEGRFIMLAKILAGMEIVTASNCDGLTDETLQFVVDTPNQELLYGPAANSAYYSQVNGISEGYKAIYAKMHCILQHKDDRVGGLHTFGYILSGFVAIVLLGSALCTLKWRKEKIIIASSVKMLGIIFLGAAITLSYILFPRYDQLSDCYLRKYVLQIGIALMFAALEAKTRRLHVIQQSIKQLKRVKITDRDLILRVSGMTLFAVVYLTVLVLVWPIEIRQRVVNRERMLICEWNDTAETLYKVLFALIVVALFMIGRISWSLRATNKLYNELSISRNISTSSHLSILLCDCHFQNKVDRAYSVFYSAPHRRILTRRVGGREFVQIYFGVVFGDITGVVGYLGVNAAQVLPDRPRDGVQSRFSEIGYSHCIIFGSDRRRSSKDARLFEEIWISNLKGG